MPACESACRGTWAHGSGAALSGTPSGLSWRRPAGSDAGLERGKACHVEDVAAVFEARGDGVDVFAQQLDI